MVITPEYELDVRGEKCPFPLIRTIREMDNIPVGGVLEIIANEPEAWQNIDIWITNSGHKFLDVIIRKKDYHIFVQKLKKIDRDND